MAGNNEGIGDLAAANVFSAAITKFGDIIEWSIKAGMSNPVQGAVASIIIADVLATAKIIKPEAQNIINVLVIAALAVDLTDQSLDAFTDILPFAPKANNTAVTPGATTLVFGGETITSGEIGALMQLINTKKG